MYNLDTSYEVECNLIACLFVADFALWVESQRHPHIKLEGLIVARAQQGGDKVYALSSKAVQAGVRRGMSIRQACLMFPQAQTVSANIVHYQRQLEKLVTTLRDYANRIEPVRIHEKQPDGVIYLELGKLRRADADFLGQRLLDNLYQRTGLKASLGMAKSKFGAFVAAQSEENEQIKIITPDEEAAFLAPQPISLLPVGKEMARQFALLGLQTLGQLAALPSTAVFNQFGNHGRRIHLMACGLDERRVYPQKPVLQEQCNWLFDSPVESRLILENVVCKIADSLHKRLSERGLETGHVSLNLVLDDRSQVEDSMALHKSISSAEKLNWTLRYLLWRMVVPCGVSEMVVYLSELSQSAPKQLSLFTEDQTTEVDNVLLKLISRYGVEPFYRAIPVLPDAMRLEQRFWLAPVQPDWIETA